MIHQPIQPICGWSLTEATVTRRLQEELCCLLIVKAIYPVLVLREDAGEGQITATVDAAERFNDCYARAAEAFVDGGLRTYGEDVKKQFLAFSLRERACFLRRELICRITAVVNTSVQAENSEVCVDTEITYGPRRARRSVSHGIAKHTWTFPQGFLSEKTVNS